MCLEVCGVFDTLYFHSVDCGVVDTDITMDGDTKAIIEAILVTALCVFCVVCIVVFALYIDYFMQPYSNEYHEANCHTVKEYTRVDHTHRCEGY